MPGEEIVPKPVDCDPVQQEQESAAYQDERNTAKLQSKEDQDQAQHKGRVNGVTPRSDSDHSPLSKNTLISLIWREISEATEECVHVYEGVDIETADSVLEELDQGEIGEYIEGITHRYVSDPKP